MSVNDLCLTNSPFTKHIQFSLRKKKKKTKTVLNMNLVILCFQSEGESCTAKPAADKPAAQQ